MGDKICFFIGHREAPDALRPALLQAVENYIVQFGVTQFVVGNHGNFDKFAAAAVRQLKQQYPHIRLILLRCYHPAVDKTPLPDGFDDSFYPPNMENVPSRYAIVRANQQMVRIANHMIAYVCHPASNAQKILALARRRQAQGKMQVTDINDIGPEQKRTKVAGQ